MSGDVYVLGAGFSKAVHDRMPVLSELSQQVRESLDHVWLNEWGPDLAANVELLLTYLVGDHPWESPHERHEALGYYYQIQAVVTSWIAQAEYLTLAAIDPPGWLLRLCESWFRNRSPVITFNYDTLIEHAVFHADTHPFELSGPHLYVVPITPARSRIGAVVGRSDNPGFPLLKLHGSLNWWYSGPESPPGDAVYGTNLFGRWGVLDDGEEVQQTVSDKQRLVVPPNLAKEPFYSNSVLREQWRRARKALADADRVILMGYSLPATDLTSRLLLTTASDGGLVEVVDRDPEAAERIQQTSLPGFAVHQAASGESAIEDYVASRLEG